MLVNQHTAYIAVWHLLQAKSSGQPVGHLDPKPRPFREPMMQRQKPIKGEN